MCIHCVCLFCWYTRDTIYRKIQYLQWPQNYPSNGQQVFLIQQVKLDTVGFAVLTVGCVRRDVMP